jgi:hypothetical protein
LNVLFPVGTGPNIVGAAEVDYAEAAAEAPIDTFLDDGSYNKTTWATGDKITSGKLNKIEDAIYEINANASDIPTVPTNISEFTNDSGYMISNTITRIEVVDALPETEEDGVLYIVKDSEE